MYSQRARRRPLVEQVRDFLARDFVFNGAVEPGGLLPSEKELAEQYGVSRVTLRASMRSLQEAGLIASRHGVGWAVLRGEGMRQGLDRLNSLETLARETGKQMTTENVESDEVPADATISAKLQVPVGYRVLCAKRVKLIDGVRVGWLLDYVPEGIVPFDVVKAELGVGSILDVLLAYRAVGVEYADTEIQPVNLAPDLAERLHAPVGAAALLMDSIAWTADGRIAEWAQSWLLPEHFRFCIRRQRQIGG